MDSSSCSWEDGTLLLCKGTGELLVLVSAAVSSALKTEEGGDTIVSKGIVTQ